MIVRLDYFRIDSMLYMAVRRRPLLKDSCEKIGWWRRCSLGITRRRSSHVRNDAEAARA